jgi:Flp pilus assembly protein TadD
LIYLSTMQGMLLATALSLLSVAPLHAARLTAANEAMLAAIQAQLAEQPPANDSLANTRAQYEAALAADPSNTAAQSGEVRVCEQLALTARANGNDTLALRTLLDALHVLPNNAQLLYDAGVQEDSMKLYWDADKAVARLQTLPGGNTPDGMYLAARIKMDLGQLSPAEQDMRAYLQAKPNDATAHYGLARILQLEEHFDQARVEFEKSLALQPEQTESQFELGEIALEQGRDQDAIDQYAQTLAGNPKHGGALTGTGIAMFRLKHYALAETWLRKATAAAPDYQPAHYYLGLTLGRLGRQAEARLELAQAASMAQAQNMQASQRLHIVQNPTNTVRPQ